MERAINVIFFSLTMLLVLVLVACIGYQIYGDAFSVECEEFKQEVHEWAHPITGANVATTVTSTCVKYKEAAK